MVHIHNGILLSHKKENAIWNHMDGPRDNQTKWSKSEKERQIPYDISYMWNPKSDTSEPNNEIKKESRNTYIHTYIYVYNGIHICL